MTNRDTGWFLVVVGFVLIFFTGPLGFFIMLFGALLVLFGRRRKCWNCGATWREGQIYCTRCGAKLEPS